MKEKRLIIKDKATREKLIEITKIMNAHKTMVEHLSKCSHAASIELWSIIKKSFPDIEFSKYPGVVYNTQDSSIILGDPK